MDERERSTRRVSRLRTTIITSGVAASLAVASALGLHTVTSSGDTSTDATSSSTDTSTGSTADSSSSTTSSSDQGSSALVSGSGSSDSSATTSGS